MADGTPIEWTDATWQIVTGCSVVSPGCTHCYAMRLAGTRMKNHPSRVGLTIDSKAGPVWNGQVRFNAEWLTQPLRWKRPRRIFVAAHGDLFHEGVTDDQLDQVFAVMALAPQHTFQVLTKRPERMRAYLAAPEVVRRICTRAADDRYKVTPDPRRRPRAFTRLMQQSAKLTAWTRPRGAAAVVFEREEPGRAYPSWVDWPLPNVWLGVSVEDQARADERIPPLLATIAAVRWISAEPLLGPVDLAAVGRRMDFGKEVALDTLRGEKHTGKPLLSHGAHLEYWSPRLDWVVAGGESGPGARPMHPEWARQLRDQCAAAGVPFLFKQWGEWTPGENAQSTIGKPVDTADWFNDRWHFERLSAAAADEQGIEDEPTLYRAGKKAAGRLLDGQLHDAFPEAPLP